MLLGATDMVEEEASVEETEEELVAAEVTLDFGLLDLFLLVNLFLERMALILLVDISASLPLGEGRFRRRDLSVELSVVVV